jgi:hypothetical protein
LDLNNKGIKIFLDRKKDNPVNVVIGLGIVELSHVDLTETLRNGKEVTFWSVFGMKM